MTETSPSSDRTGSRLALSIGLEIKEGLFDRVIAKGTRLPAGETRIFTTAEDNQSSVQIRVFQGEQDIAEENEFLGVFHLTGIPPAPAGVPSIEVTFWVNEDGSIEISAVDRATDTSEKMSVPGAADLSNAKIEPVKQEAAAQTETASGSTRQGTNTTAASTGQYHGGWNKIAGIDFGTTDIRCAIMEGGDPKVVPCGSDGAIPSVVSVADRGEIIAGQPAAERASTYPDYSVDDLVRQLGSDAIELGGVEYVPEGLAAVLLQRIKRDLNEYVGGHIKHAVITVPAYYSARQRQVMRDAGEIAGFEVERVINSPAAATMAYGFNSESDRTVLVCDLGGGTFDVSILDIGGGVYEVIATNGDTKLGGDDWDRAVVDWVIAEFEQAHGIDLSSDSNAQRRILEAVRGARTDLLSRNLTEVFVPNVTAPEAGGLDLQQTLTREKFRSITDHLLERLEAPVITALNDAGYSFSDIDETVLTGGFTWMPSVREQFQEGTGMEPWVPSNPTDTVALGAAIQGGILSGEVEDVVLFNVTSLSLGIEVKGGLFERVIKRNTTVPTEESKIFTTAEDEQKEAEIRIFQGENEIAEENDLLGEFLLTDLTSTDEGSPIIEVTFSIDENSIVSVSAEEGSIIPSERDKPQFAPNEAGAGAEITIEAAYGSLTQKAVKNIRSSVKDNPVRAESLTYSDPQIRNASDERVGSIDAEIVSYSDSSTEEVEEEAIELLLEVKDDLRRATTTTTNTDEPSAIRDGLNAVDRKIQRFIESASDESSKSVVSRRLETVRQAFDEILSDESASATEVRDQVSTIAGRVESILHWVDGEVIDPEPGDPTDETRHMVVGKETSQQQSGRIVSVEKSGYERGDTVQRPAKVTVSAAPEPKPPDEIPAAPNMDVDYFELETEERVGRGDNADVYRATVAVDGSSHALAVKLPRIEGAARQEVLDQFVREAQKWAKIDDHDHIVDVVDWGTKPVPWIVMEYMDGNSLDMYAGNLPSQHGIWTALRITQAVYHAHQRGVTHLNLNPQNVLFRETESSWNIPKVGDWGVSQHLLEHSQGEEGFSSHYAAPEQATDEYGSTDEITDIYQLGMVLYELFTGQSPFEETPSEPMHRVLHESPTPPTEVADVPDALDDIILTALAKEKGDRYEKTLYFRDALAELYDE